MDYQRILIFMGLAVTGYLLMLAWQEDYGHQATRIQVESSTTGTVDAFPSAPAAAGGESPAQTLSSDTFIPNVEAAPTSVPSTLSASIVHVQTDVFSIDIDLLGGDIVSLALPKYPAALVEPDRPLKLMDSGNQYVAQSGLIGPDGTDKNGARPIYETSAGTFELKTGQSELEVVLTPRYPDENGVRISKIFTFKPQNYLIDVRYEITNGSNSPVNMAFFGQIKRDGRPPLFQVDNAMGLQPYLGIATRTQEDLYDKIDLSDLEDGAYQQDFTGGYIAFLQHYFLSAWVPTQSDSVRYYARALNVTAEPEQNLYTLGFTSGVLTVAQGGRGQLGGSFYAGPKNQATLAEISKGLDLTVDYGFLWFIAQPLFSALTWIHSLVNNWGFAIILLTVCVKTLLYPLSAASFKSMAKMRKLQPEMVRLKERYGEDRQKFSQAMMELYKKEGANPLGGCLPILLQMPVFLALYWTLMESVELRHAPFILWIDDLSVMDPFFVLPILMGISMYLTQMMQPEPPDPVQAKVFKFMPIIFTVFFLWFPSGLVLYWLINNILSVLQQLYVTRQLENAPRA
jgi:YidC/Oxa1 family membrane protein insertase